MRRHLKPSELEELVNAKRVEDPNHARTVYGPWWRASLFDVVRLEDARHQGCRCAVCGSLEITGCWGAMWAPPVAWGCTTCRTKYSDLQSTLESERRSLGEYVATLFGEVKSA